MSTFALSPQLSASPELKFSDSHSAGLFVEALQLIRRYEETSSRPLLERAHGVLEDCLKVSPRDVLPKFYLGITQSALGDMDQKEPIRIFKEFSKSKIFPLKAAAKYNLAAAYVETYNTTKFREGVNLLNGLLKELKSEGVPLGRSEGIRDLQERFGDRRIRVEQLFYQAEETRDYMHIHLHVWAPRWDGATDKIENESQLALAKLTTRLGKLREHDRFLGRQRDEIWAWHWNNVGIIHESLAAIARRKRDGRRVDEEAKRAERAFDEARDADPSFASSRPNLGRVYFEVLGDFQKATEIFEEVARGVEDTTYAHFCLGLLYAVERKRVDAMHHLLEAPDLLKYENIGVDDWTGIRRYVARQLRIWGQADAALDLLREVAGENPFDDDLRRQIEDLEREA